MNRDDRILLLCKLAFDGIYFGVGASCVLEVKIRLSHHIISSLTEPLLFGAMVSLDCAFSRLGRAFCNLILASSMAIDFDFFGQKMVFAVVFGAFSVRAFGARCGSRGFSFLAQESLLARRP